MQIENTQTEVSKQIKTYFSKMLSTKLCLSVPIEGNKLIVEIP